MDPLYTSITISLRVALLATFVAFCIGVPTAWLLAHGRLPGKRVLDVLVNLPLALPPTVLGYYLLLLIGRNGPVGRLVLSFTGQSLIFTPTAAVIAAAIVSLPLLTQAARNAFAEIDTEVLEAAQVDGAGRRRLLLDILIPLAWPGIWSGVLLAYARSLGEFGATLMVAGNIPGRTQTVSLAIYSAVQSGEIEKVHLLALLLTGIAGVSIWFGLRWRQPRTYQRSRRPTREDLTDSWPNA